MSMVECQLCPKHCRLTNGARGDCRVRLNIDGKLYSLVYGKPCAVHIDPIEKKPLYHVLPATSAFSIATAGCNGHCKFCQNWQISQRPPEETHNFDLPPGDVVRQAKANQCRSIAYTYTDPIIFYEYTYDTSKIAKEAGLYNVLVTAGSIEEKPLIELCSVTHAVNVDLKSIREDYYRDICDLKLRPVQEAILTMKKQGLWIELTNLVIPTLNDSEKDIGDLCRWVKANCGTETPLHFSRFWPVYQLRNIPPTPVATLNRAYDIAKSQGIHFVYVGNVSGHPGNHTYCPQCGKIIIRRQGYRIMENHITQGRCGFCQNNIPGLWP